MELPDIVVDIVYYEKDVAKTVITTNAKPEALEEILGAWCQAQIGQGKDSRQAVERELYHITISLQLEDDSFTTRSDTGNNSLTAGIVMHLLAHLDKVTIQPFGDL